ncbi:hypothetical protein SUGI_0045820 [Cryptomeria japonica]|uniref:GDSL esterase/lipase At1g28600 n=1 Tax=Cryptomeria japonica TaxID=3369 RepID=UPI002408E436|nr:GDSL esterase/lipase At1g28600 [Cryptomeria japonica]GLJ06708.1 hypothetical protein SUGI_0045820 [Cryptomeria japonica]
MKYITILLMVLVFSQTYLGDCKCSIYSFGDSLADTGNLLISNHQGLGAIIGKFPYGETFGFPTGRCSDGRLIVDFIAKALGSSFLKPYLHKNANFSDGINFAVAGATALESSFLTANGIGPLWTNNSLDTQINWFLEYKRNFCSSNEDCESHFANAMFLMGEIGGNDYNYPFAQQRPLTEVESLIPLVINKIKVALETLINSGGARKILIQNNLPIGCSPSYLSTKDGEKDSSGCLKDYNEFSEKSNKLLKQMVKRLQQKNPRVSIVFADYYNAALTIIKKPSSYGLQRDVLQTCCGAGGPYKFDIQHLCGTPGSTTCHNSQQYFNWDGIHLTEAAYKQIASMFMDGKFTNPSFNSVFKNG